MKVAYTVAAPEAQADRVLAWRGPLEELLPALAELGYDGMELMVCHPESLDADAIHSLAGRYGLSIPVIGTGPIALERHLTLSAPDDAVRAEAISAAQAALRLCAVFDAILNIGQFRGRCQPADVQLAKSRFADSLLTLIPLAEKLSVRIALEPQNRFQSSYFRTTGETLEFIQSLGSDQVGLVLDTFHNNIEESSLHRPFQLAAERLFHVHFSENHRGAPGSGLIPFDSVVQTLNEIGYAGWVSIEIAQTPSPLEAAKAALEGYRKICRQG